MIRRLLSGYTKNTFTVKNNSSILKTLCGMDMKMHKGGYLVALGIFYHDSNRVLNVFMTLLYDGSNELSFL